MRCALGGAALRPLGLLVALGIAPASAEPSELRHATWQALDGLKTRRQDDSLEDS